MIGSYIYRIFDPTAAEYTFSHAHMKYSPRWTPFCAVKPTTICLKEETLLWAELCVPPTEPHMLMS